MKFRPSAVLVAFKQRRCFSSEGASIHSLAGIPVLVAFKQRRCFSSVGEMKTSKMHGVGRFQTAKVFLPYPPQHIDYKINLDYFSVGNVF